MPLDAIIFILYWAVVTFIAFKVGRYIYKRFIKENE